MALSETDVMVLKMHCQAKKYQTILVHTQYYRCRNNDHLEAGRSQTAGLFLFFSFLFLFSGQLFLFRANSHKRPVRSKQFNDLKNVFYQPLLRGSVRYKKVPLPTPRSTLTSFGFEFAVNMTKIYLG